MPSDIYIKKKKKVSTFLKNWDFFIYVWFCPDAQNSLASLYEAKQGFHQL